MVNPNQKRPRNHHQNAIGGRSLSLSLSITCNSASTAATPTTPTVQGRDMKLSPIALLCLVASSLTLTAFATMTTNETKIQASLLTAVRADPQVEADIMIQLESPEEAMHRVCGADDDGATALSQAQKTTCMVDNMQQFADASQQQVKDLLAQHSGQFADSTFFWINNSVSVKKAKGQLVLALSSLETVLEIHSEQIFHTMASGGGQGNEEKYEKKKATTFGFGILN